MRHMESSSVTEFWKSGRVERGPPDGDPGPPVRAARAAAAARSRFAPMARLVRAYRVLSRALHRTVLAVAAHDCLNIAQSAAYSAMVRCSRAGGCRAVVGLLPDTAPVRFQLAAFFDRVLPPGVSPLLDAAFENSPAHTHSDAHWSAPHRQRCRCVERDCTLMEGLRRARQLPRDSWSFWQRRRRSLELVPLRCAAYRRQPAGRLRPRVTAWLSTSIGPQGREPIYAITVLIRWAVALSASVGLMCCCITWDCRTNRWEHAARDRAADFKPRRDAGEVSSRSPRSPH